MTTNRPRRRLRATVLGAVAVGALAVTWRCRPAVPATTSAPDTDVIRGCAWLLWALSGYLAAAVLATAVAELAPATRATARPLARVTPATLRRLIDGLLSVSLLATMTATITGPTANAAPREAAISRDGPWAATDGPATSGPALDWPGLPSPSTLQARAQSDPPSAHGSRPTAAAAGARHRRHPSVALVAGGPAGGSTRTTSDVVVRAGDTLWAIAARHLEPGASAAAITNAWHRWYAANRLLIGADPGLILPGQHLQPPPGAGSAPHQNRSPR